MKRSEAKRLFVEYYEKQRELNMRFTGEDFVVCAEQIIGMLPPMQDNYSWEDYRYDIEPFSWEPEDD